MCHHACALGRIVEAEAEEARLAAELELVKAEEAQSSLELEVRQKQEALEQQLEVSKRKLAAENENKRAETEQALKMQVRWMLVGLCSWWPTRPYLEGFLLLHARRFADCELPHALRIRSTPLLVSVIFPMGTESSAWHFVHRWRGAVPRVGKLLQPTLQT